MNHQSTQDMRPIDPSPVPIPFHPGRVIAGTTDADREAMTRVLANPSLMCYREWADGIRRVIAHEVASLDVETPPADARASGLHLALLARREVSHGYITPTIKPKLVDSVVADVLVVPRSERWREAVSTALVGDWIAPLFHTGHLPYTALGALKAEARALHRQLVPVWQRRTRQGRVLSLDAALGNGLSLYDLVAADVDLLARARDGVFEDVRLNAVLRALGPTERQVVFAYAEGEGTTWAEAAAFAGAREPEAFGERVRRKAKRLAAEQRRRLAARCSTQQTDTS